MSQFLFPLVPTVVSQPQDAGVDPITIPAPDTKMTLRDKINEFLDLAEARGMESYGKSLEDQQDGRDWMVELIEELIDALYYAAKEIKTLRDQINGEV